MGKAIWAHNLGSVSPWSVGLLLTAFYQAAHHGGQWECVAQKRPHLTVRSKRDKERGYGVSVPSRACCPQLEDLPLSPNSKVPPCPSHITVWN